MNEQNRDNSLHIKNLLKGSAKFLGDSKLEITSRIILVEIIVIAVLVGIFYPREPKLPLHPVKRAVGWDTLMIDGNRNRHGVSFPHLVCSKAAGEEREDCRVCHHLSRPNDGPSSCAECHRDMLYTISIFDHKYHEEQEGGNKSCVKCHEKDKAKENVKACTECHSEYPSDLNYQAVSYKAAMHSACVECHKEVDLSGMVTEYSECKICHKDIEELMEH
jgi:hypothetical protein